MKYKLYLFSKTVARPFYKVRVRFYIKPNIKGHEGKSLYMYL